MSISWEAKWSSVQSEQDCPHVFIEAQRSRRGLSLKCGRGVWIPQEKDAANISQNCPRPPRNPEEKVFFSVTVKGIPTDLTEVGLMDSSGGLDHSSMAKPEKKDLHMIFLVLNNAFGSIPHELLWAAFSFFYIPKTITALVESFYQDLKFCSSHLSFPTLGRAFKKAT